MEPIKLTSSHSPEVAEQVLGDAARHLKTTEKGRAALRALAGIADDLVALDSRNQRALLQLMHGVFTHPGTGRDVLKEAAEIHPSSEP
jgi:hypothetical protein